MENPFNLVDDFIEPYRFIVERWAAISRLDQFDSAARKEIVGFVKMEIKFEEAEYRLPSAIDESVASFVRVLAGKSKHLHLPLDAVMPKDNDEPWV